MKTDKKDSVVTCCPTGKTGEYCCTPSCSCAQETYKTGEQKWCKTCKDKKSGCRCK